MATKRRLHSHNAFAFAFLLPLAGCGVAQVFNGLHTINKSESAGAADSGVGADGAVIMSPGVATAVRISPDAPGCGRGQIAQASQTPIDFMMTLDRSGSMNDSKEAAAQHRATKWLSLQQAVRAVVDDMGRPLAGAAAEAVGLDYFSDGSGDSVVEQPLALLDRARADALMADISGRTPGGFTPTEDALRLSYTALEAFDPGGVLANANKVLVFVSDGKPNPVPADPATIPTLIAAQLSGPAHVRTFSIGIGELNDTSTNGYDPLFMADVAIKGGTAKPGCDPTNSTDPTKFCHYQVTPSASANITDDLLAAFADIRRAVRSCRLPLGIADPTHLEPRAVIVVAEKADLGQRILPHDPTNGWVFDDDAAPTAVILNGDECDTIKLDPSEHVFAIIGCSCTGATGSSGLPPPGRSAEGVPAGTDPWNTNWCSYPFATGPSGCLGEGCPP